MRLSQIALVSCFWLAALSASADAQQSQDPQQRIYRSLERIGDAAARLETTFCNVDLAQTFQGAIDGINAMPERSGETPLQMSQAGLEEFADIYADLLQSAPNVGAIEKAAINGMVRVYDPTGSWYTWQDVPRNRPGGIMVRLTLDGDAPRIAAVEAGGPAQQAGILPGDHLVSIDDQTVAGLSLNEVVALIQGDINSYLIVIVERNGERIEFTIQRVRNVHTPVTWRVEGTVGVITLESFPENSAVAVRNAIREIRHEAHTPTGYIVDLRGNSGGLLDQVIEAADHFIDGGAVTIVRAVSECYTDAAQTYNARRRDETRGATLVVLIDHVTASGAELLAATLKDRRNATLIGEQSFGNALIHTVIPMQGGRDGFLKLNTGMLTDPSGGTWNETGLTPDIVTAPRTDASDPALDRAIALLSAAN